MNLLFGSGSTTPAETGLSIGSNGVINTSGLEIGGYLFDYGSWTLQNAFTGFAGNTTMTGGNNTANGSGALISNTTGNGNTAGGFEALLYNGGGTDNTAVGFSSLWANTTGGGNTASGSFALSQNTTGSGNTGLGGGAGETADGSAITGSYNTFLGESAGLSTGSLSNATAIGAFAEVGESNALVLGSFAGASVCPNAGCANTNVGIGTATPGHLLEVDGDATTAQIAMVSSGTDAAISVNNTATGGREYWIDSGSGSAGVGAGNFAVHDRTAAATRFVISSVGNVGIGTTAPTAALDVVGNGLQALVGDPGCGSGFAAIGFVNKGGFNTNCSNYALLGDVPGNVYLNSSLSGAILFRNNNNTLMAIGASGEVGIGTTSPDSLLSVAGSADKPGGGSWGTFSDARLKTVNGGFTDGLSQIMKIQPIHYRYKPDNAMGIRDTGEHVGVVAQEVQKVIPEAVTENSKGYLLVNNDPIIWTMLNAIKEQQGQFQQEKTELAKALTLIKQQQDALRAQSAAMRGLRAEVRETRESLRKVKAQVAAVQPALVAVK